MTHKLSLAFLTLFDVGPVETIRIAAETGYDMVGLRLLPAGPAEAPYPLMHDDKVFDEAVRALADTELAVGDVEIIRLNATTDVNGFIPFLEKSQKLGAKHVLVAGDDENRTRLTETYGKFCTLSQSYGMTADLEFMPWTKVPDLKAAREIVEAVNLPNAGVLVDALHLARCGSTLEEVKALPARLINYVQFCDALLDYDPSDEGLIKIARSGRLYPGEGELPLLELLKVIPRDVTLSIEVPNHKLAETMSAKERARHGLKTMRAMMDEAGRA